MTDSAVPAIPSVLEYAPVRSRAPFRWLDTLGWAGYLGCSWTWCIGMFLPVLLIRDYGIAGWWAFAIPNVIGAAAMGWIIRTRQHSEQLVRFHRPAIRVFSIVTVSFHVFFVRWMISQLGNWRAPWWAHYGGNGLSSCVLPAALILPCLLIFLVFRSQSDRLVAAGVLLVSVAIAGACIKLGMFPNPFHGFYYYSFSYGLSAGRINLECLTPIMVFGFLLCPYLDQTFHRARQLSAHPRSAFALGFGLVFAAMIIFTLDYSAFLHLTLWGWRGGFPSIWSPALAVLIWIHLMIQSGVTMQLHLRDATREDGRELTPMNLVALALAYAVGIYASLASKDGEFTYRIFLGFYALVFPAYVLICMRPWQKGIAAPSARQWTFFGGAVVLAGPLFLMGITGDNRLPMFGGLLVVLVMGAAERVSRTIAMRKKSVP